MIRTTITSAFVTCVVVRIDVFESEIVDEKHFATAEEAKEFKDTLPDDLVAIIASLT